MLLSFIKYFRGYVEVTLWGYAPERFFNLCSNHDILIWDIAQQGDTYQFKVSVRGFFSLKPLLKKSGTHIRLKEKNGVPFFFFRYRKRKILFASIFLCMVILFTLSRFIWKIDIRGNDSVTDDSILQFLKEQDSCYGTNISDIDCEKLEEELRSCFADIIWTSCKREGTTLTIDVQENLVVKSEDANGRLPKEFKEQEQSGYDLLAMHDGTIDSIYVRKGTPLVEKGAQVKKGDVLVSGALPIYDDNGEVCAYQYCTADADIKLQTDYTYKERFSIRHQQKIYSENKTARYGISVGSRYLQLPWAKVPFRQYTVMETRNQLRLCDSFYLPVYFVQREYEEYETRQLTYSQNEAVDYAKKNLAEYLKKLTQKGVLILEKNVMIKKGKNKYTVSGSITVLENTFQYAVNNEHMTNAAGTEEDEGDTRHESE